MEDANQILAQAIKSFSESRDAEVAKKMKSIDPNWEPDKWYPSNTPVKCRICGKVQQAQKDPWDFAFFTCCNVAGQRASDHLA